VQELQEIIRRLEFRIDELLDDIRRKEREHEEMHYELGVKIYIIEGRLDALMNENEVLRRNAEELADFKYRYEGLCK
jgi:hypothetical protein